MKPAISTTDSPIEWAVAERTYPGQAVSGDLHLVQPYENGVLLAVVDGVGHGPEATRVAETAVTALRQQPGDTTQSLINRCNEALRQTRGVVLTVASFDVTDGTVTWSGIGNVEALLFRCDGGRAASEKALVQSGTIGAKLPPLYRRIVAVNPGDVLVMTTDGIRQEFERDIPVKAPTQRIADHIIEKYYNGTDDACVLVARFVAIQGHE